MRKLFAILLIWGIAQPVVAVNRSVNPVLDTADYSLYLYKQAEIDRANEEWYREQERLRKEQLREGCQSQDTQPPPPPPPPCPVDGCG